MAESISNNIKQLFQIAINPANGKELSQDDKELIELLAAVMADRDKFRVVIEQTNPNTDALKDQITDEIEQHLKDQGVDSDTINSIKAKIAAISPQAYDKYLTMSQLTNVLKAYAKTSAIPSAPNLSAYATYKYIDPYLTKMSALVGQFKTFYDNEYTKNANTIKVVSDALKGINNQIGVLSTEVTKNIDSLTQAHQDYNELLANNATQEELEAASKAIEDKLKTLATSIGDIRAQQNAIKAKLAGQEISSWQRNIPLYIGPGGLPTDATEGSLEITKTDVWVELFKLSDNSPHKAYVEIHIQGKVVDFPLNIRGWQEGWNAVRAMQDYYLPGKLGSKVGNSDFSIRVDRGSDGSSSVMFKTSSPDITQITIGEL